MPSNPSSDQAATPAEANPPHLIIMEAIARRLTVLAQYNRQVIELAPHLLFSRHEDLFLGALNLNKQRREGDEPILGKYKLAGLSDLKLTDTAFDPLPGFESAVSSPDEKVVFAVA